MPRNEGYRAQGSSLEKGAATRLNKGVQDIEQGEFQAVFGDGPDDEYDEVLFGPTAFPERPITYGASFGPGTNSVRLPNQTPRDHLLRVAENIVANKDSLPDDALVWAINVIAEG